MARKMVTSSVMEISMDRVGNRVVVRQGALLQQASGQIFKDDVSGFFSTSDICFMVLKMV